MTRRTVLLGVAVVVVLLITLLAPLATRDREVAVGTFPPGGPPVGTPLPGPTEGDTGTGLDDITDDPTLSQPSPQVAEESLDGEPVAGLDGEELYLPASPRNVASALDFASTYYTLPSGTLTADHRQALRPWVTDAVFARLTSDPDGLFEQADAVRGLTGEVSIGTVVEHQVLAENDTTTRVLVIVEAMVTAQAQERRDTHSLVMDLTAPTVTGGRWLISDLTINPTSGADLT